MHNFLSLMFIKIRMAGKFWSLKTICGRAVQGQLSISMTKALKLPLSFPTSWLAAMPQVTRLCGKEVAEQHQLHFDSLTAQRSYVSNFSITSSTIPKTKNSTVRGISGRASGSVGPLASC